MQCSTHPETDACGACAACFKNLCEACSTYELDHSPCCERCGRAKEDDRNALSSGLLALIAVGYLAALAVGIVVFKPRPFVGGLAAIVAIALGRAMQLLATGPDVRRRLGGPGRSASPPAAAPASSPPPSAPGAGGSTAAPVRD
jgi:hypothetical protein